MKTKKRKYPEQFERMDSNLIFLTAIVVGFVFYAAQFDSPLFCKIFCSLFILAIPCALIWIDFNAMRERRFMIETYWSERESV